MEILLGNFGSVDDIRCHLQLICWKKGRKVYEDLSYLSRSLDSEKEGKNRKTVIEMIERKMRNIEDKQLRPW